MTYITLGIGIFIFIGLTILFIVRNIKYGFRQTRNILIANVSIIAAVCVMFYFCFPYAANIIFFKTLYINFFNIFFSTVAIAIAWRGLKKNIEKRNKAMAIIFGLAAALCFILGNGLLPRITDSIIAEEYKFDKIDSLIEVNPKAIIFTPQTVAYQDMIQNNASSEYTVARDFTDPIDLDNGFGYISPIAPDGIIMTFNLKNSGFMVYNDNYNVHDNKRIERVKEEFEIGEGMQWLDNVERSLYSLDRFCDYPEVHYLQIDKNNKRNFIGVAPKIKYRYSFPFFFIPYWGGVALIHSDGKIEELTPAEALARKDLVKKWIYPKSLAKQIVESQIYDQGFLSGLYQRPGKIQVPELTGSDQMPYFFTAMDNTSYFMVATEPSGGSEALFRMYYINTHTGERSFLEWDVSNAILGPKTSIQRVKQLEGRMWVEEQDNHEIGNFRIVQPIYLTKGQILYWKFTITNREYVGVVSTVVVNAVTKQIEEFNTREKFFCWLDQTLCEKQPTDEMQTFNSDSKHSKPTLQEVKA